MLRGKKANPEETENHKPSLKNWEHEIDRGIKTQTLRSETKLAKIKASCGLETKKKEQAGPAQHKWWPLAKIKNI